MAVGFDPIPRKELYLDVITGGDSELPEPLTREEIYLAKIAGMAVDIPEPLTRYEQYLYAIANGDTLTLNPIPRLEMYLAKACGQDIDVPEPITREEKYWFDYISGGRWETLEYTGAVPVTITAAGEPLIEMIISGNMSQSGTPSPSSIVMPQETGERTGNLFDLPDTTTPTTISDVAWSITNGTIRGSGTTTSAALGDAVVVYDGFHRNGNYINYCSVKPEWAIKLPAGAYTFSATIIKDGTSTISFLVGKSGATMQAGTAQRVKPGNSFTTDGEDYAMLVVVTDSSHSEYEYSNIMLNSGSTALPYEPYGIKIPISSANTTTPVYLGEVETERKIRKRVLTGEETWSSTGSGASRYYRMRMGSYGVLLSGLIICTHTTQASITSQTTEYGCNVINSESGNASYIAFRLAGITEADDFKTYLQQQYANGTPVTVWYVLATPTTGIVNEPLRKIGTYADTLSVSEGVSIPTVEGSNVVDVETTLKPSEIYLKYKGRSS